MAKTKRQGIPKSVRFEVFKRDSFKCQYCGASAPDVLLEVDHIHPLAKGGESIDITNLITACNPCNSGKSDRVLADDAAITKKKRQLDDLQARREQIEMMADWQRALVNLDHNQLSECEALWNSLVIGYYLAANGRQDVRKLIKQFGMGEVMEAMRTAAARYLEVKGASHTSDSVAIAFSKIGGICFISRRRREDPELEDVYRMAYTIATGGFLQ